MRVSPFLKVRSTKKRTSGVEFRIKKTETTQSSTRRQLSQLRCIVVFFISSRQIQGLHLKLGGDQEIYYNILPFRYSPPSYSYTLRYLTTLSNYWDYIASVTMNMPEHRYSDMREQKYFEKTLHFNSIRWKVNSLVINIDTSHQSNIRYCTVRIDLQGLYHKQINKP